MGAACPRLPPVSQPTKSTATPAGSLGQPGAPQPASCLREGTPQKGQPGLQVHQCSLGIQSPWRMPDETVGLCWDPASSGAQVPFTALQFSVTLITIILLPFIGHLLSARPSAKCFSRHHHIQPSGPPSEAGPVITPSYGRGNGSLRSHTYPSLRLRDSSHIVSFISISPAGLNSEREGWFQFPAGTIHSAPCRHSRDSSLLSE